MKDNRDILYWDNKLSWSTAFYFICDAANTTIKSIFPIPESLWGAISAFFGIAIILGFANCFKEMLRRSGIYFWRVVYIFLIVYGFSALQYVFNGYPLGVLIKGNIILTFAWWIPVGIYMASVKNKDCLYDVWVKASYIISVLCILIFFFHQPNEDQNSTEYNMSFGFKIVLPLLFQMNEFLKKKKVLLLLFILFQIVLILLYSNRGPLLAIIFFSIYKYAFESGNKFRKIISIIFLVTVAFIMMASIQTLAENAIAILDMFGFESRTLSLLAEGLADKTSGRDEIWGLCFKMIEERPFGGWGLGGEYFRIGSDLFSVPVESVTPEAYNPHNGIIQNFVCFGIIGGLFVNSMIVIPFFHLNSRNKSLHNLLLIFASACVIPIFVSASGFFIKPGVSAFLFLFYSRYWKGKRYYTIVTDRINANRK